MRWASPVGLRTFARRSRRIFLPLLWLFRCDDPQGLCRTLPLAETLNRFLSPLWVFILMEGMVDRSTGPSAEPLGVAGAGTPSGQEPPGRPSRIPYHSDPGSANAKSKENRTAMPPPWPRPHRMRRPGVHI